MSEQQRETTTATAEKPSDAWGQPISAERQAELQDYLDRWVAESDHGGRKGPFDARLGTQNLFRLDRRLTGTDVYWLAESARAKLRAATPHGLVPVPNRHPVANPHLEGAVLIGAHLERSGLAQLQGAFLSGAHLEGSDLSGTQLEGALLGTAHLEGADLSGAWLDSKTVLTNAALDSESRLGDIQWSGVGAVNLTRINWDAVSTLGDEKGVGLGAKASEHEAVVRAYRQLATQLRAQGMSEVADRFAYRAQVLQRRVLLRQWRIGQWLFSWVLFLLAGYGYRPARTLFWYLATIAAFAFLYMQATTGWIPFGLPTPSSFAPLTWYEALILSVSSFHGRGFFQPVQSLGDPVAALAAIEAVIGLFIEISFIATFTQRYFGAR